MKNYSKSRVRMAQDFEDQLVKLTGTGEEQPPNPMEIAYDYFDRLNTDQEKWLTIYFKNKEEQTKKRKAQGMDESTDSLMFYN